MNFKKKTILVAAAIFLSMPAFANNEPLNNEYNGGKTTMSFSDITPLVKKEAEISPWQKYSDRIQDLVIKGLEFVGVPYVRGGNTVAGLDCSGFTKKVYQDSLGVELPRTAAEQSKVGLKIEQHELKPGDLVFFNTERKRNSHVGIYLGNDQFVHAPRTGKEVQVDSMQSSYWIKTYNGARRVDPKIISF
jgi:cell wall-associated NlpC family hydrolase